LDSFFCLLKIWFQFFSVARSVWQRRLLTTQYTPKQKIKEELTISLTDATNDKLSAWHNKWVSSFLMALVPRKIDTGKAT